LRPNGVIAIHDQFLHRSTEHHGYIRWRSLRDWQRLLSDAGFEIISRSPIFFSMIQPNDCSTPRSAALMDSLWRRTRSCIQRAPWAMGAFTYAADSLLSLVVDEGPS